MLKSAYVTTALYALGRQLGPVGAMTEIQRQMHAEPDASFLPVARSIHNLRKVCDGVGFDPDCGATIIGQHRSRCFHRALQQPDFPCWLSFDDDIEVGSDVCGYMLEALDDLKPRIVICPYVIRTTGTGHARLSCTIPLVRIERKIGGAKLLTLGAGQGGGFGFVGMNRYAMDRIVAAHSGDPTLRWNDEDDGGEKLAVFHDLLEGGLWWGEDTSFFRRVPDDVSVEVLLTGAITHAGIRFDLGTIQ